MTPAARRFCSLRELIAAIDDFSETLKIETLANWSSTSSKCVLKKLQVKLFNLQTLRIPDISFSYSFLAAAILEPFLLGSGFCDLRIEFEKQSMASLLFSYIFNGYLRNKLAWTNKQCLYLTMAAALLMAALVRSFLYLCLFRFALV